MPEATEQTETPERREPSETRPPPRPQDFPPSGPNSLASLVQRLGGWLLDILITIVPASAALLPFVDLEELVETGEVPVFARAVPILVWLVYEVVLLPWFGRTLGCWVVGVRVARYADGKNPSIEQSLLRALLPASIAVIPLPIINMGWIVVYMGALYNPLRRGFQDFAGGTIVIRTR
jgi:uncharacterized RDD family membrane protein YckC